MNRGFLSIYYFSYNKEDSVLFDMFFTNYGVLDLTILLYVSVEKCINIFKKNISDDDLIDNRLYVLNMIKEYESSIYNCQNVILAILKFEEHLLRKLSLFNNNDIGLKYYKAMIEYLKNMNIRYISNNDSMDVLNNNKIYRLGFKVK